MNPTTEKTTVSQSDYNNLADWAKPSYQVQTQTAPTLNQTNNQVQQSQPQASLAITPQSLQQTPQIKIPNIRNTDTTSAGVIAGTQPDYGVALQNAEKAQQSVGAGAQDAQSALTKLAENIFGQKADAQANQVNLEKQAGLQEQQKALGEINTAIASEQVAMRGEQEKIRQGYATEAQKQISNNTINDTYGRRLADLAIRQSAANQNISAIQSNAERQTKLLTAPLDTKIQYLSTFAKDNVDFLNTQQQQKLSLVIDDIKSQKADITALQNAKTQMITEIANNGGGTNQELIRQIQNAKDTSSVTMLGANSGYIGKEQRLNNALDRQYKQAQIGKIYTDIANEKVKAMGLTSMKPEDYARFQSDPKVKSLANSDIYLYNLKQYKDTIKKYGSGEVLSPTGSGALKAAYVDLVTSYKDFKNLGTWDAGSKDLISMGISEPSIWTRDSKALSAIQTLENGALNEVKSANKTLSVSPYANTSEGRTLIEKNNAILEAKQLEKVSNKDFLKSLPQSNTTTSAVDNSSFFNQ